MELCLLLCCICSGFELLHGWDMSSPEGVNPKLASCGSMARSIKELFGPLPLLGLGELDSQVVEVIP